MPDTSDTNATQVLHEQHECNMGATQTTQVQHQWKIFYFDNYKSKNIFTFLFYYMASERLKGEE